MAKKYRLHHIFYNFDTGGAQKRLRDFIIHTQDIFEHHITAFNGDYSYFDKIPDGYAQIYQMSYRKGHILKNIMSIRAGLKKLAPDCVLTHNFGSFEAVIANTPQIIPHIHNEDGFGVDEQKHLKWRRNFMRRIFLAFKTTILPSETLYKIARNHWQSLGNSIHFIPNGVPEFLPRKACPFAHPNKLIIGTVAICRPEKNLRQFIDMIAALKKIQHKIFGVLVGDGSELEALKQYAQTQNLTMDDILFTGYRTNYRDYMAYFDIFVLTSLTEQQPFSILDAMACHLPIIATHVGDIKNMVSQVNKPYIQGILQMQKFIDLITDARLRTEIGTENFKKYQYSYQLNTSLDARKKYICSKVQK